MSKIKEARSKLGLTQQQLAELTGIPFRSIQNWEGGQRSCPEYVERLLLEKLERMQAPEPERAETGIFLIYRDSLDDAATIEGYIEGTGAEAETYCEEYNKSCKYYWEEITYEKLKKLNK